MKKIVKLGIPILLVVILLAPTMSNGAYNVAVGNTFAFEAVKSNWTITRATNSSTGSGFEFEDVKYSERTAIIIQVTAASTTQVDWLWTVQAETVSGYNSGGDLFGLALYMFYPLLASLPSTWNQTALDLGPPILLPVFFVDPVEFSEFFYQMSNDTFVSTAFTDSEFIMNNIGGTFDNSSDIAVFEWHLDMTITIATDATNYSGTYTLIFAFDKITGATKGFYIDM
ncbi:MAG: choice-of-anchor S family protein, partial [Candidatus Neomarinimicrobiota bacterium]